MEHITKREEKKRIEADKRMQAIREKYWVNTDFEKRTPTTQEEARQYAIDWQNWISEQSLSYSELAEWNNVFLNLGRRFNLLSEFKANGII